MASAKKESDSIKQRETYHPSLLASALCPVEKKQHKIKITIREENIHHHHHHHHIKYSSAYVLYVDILMTML